MNRNLTASIISRHEGLSLKPYKDSVGKLTIGFGRNLDDVGITVDEAHALLLNDVERIEQSLARLVPCFMTLSGNRQMVLVNMAYNLGVVGLLQFKTFLKALEAADFPAARSAMLDSKWATQVGHRARELAAMMAVG